MINLQNTETTEPDNQKLLKVPSIIFIDDEDAILSSIKSLLRKEKFEQYYISSPREALDFLSVHHVDLIVTDLRMREMSGEQFLKLVQSISPRSIKMILSAYEEKSLVLDLLSKGFAQFYLLKPWEDESLINILKKFTALHNELERENLTDYLTSLSDLPNPSSFDDDLLEIFSGDMTIIEIARYLEKYPFFVTKLIQIANSVSYGSYRAITSVKDAVMLMGIEPLKELLLSLGILDKFQNAVSKENEPLMDDIWDRSLRRGIIAKKISSLWDVPFNKNSVFISSLVSDIGFFIWLFSEPEKYREFIQLAKTDERTLQEIEAEYFKYPHNKLGATLLELWNFPFEVVNIVLNHHENTVGNEVIKIIQLSEILEGSFPNIQHDKVIENLIPYYKEKLANDRI
jgi:HD-like signal output (HDOD) protein